MQNQEILEIIENLKGRRSYEEKKASKLGFSSLYAYFEDKIYKVRKQLYDYDVNEGTCGYDRDVNGKKLFYL